MVSYLMGTVMVEGLASKRLHLNGNGLPVLGVLAALLVGWFFAKNEKWSMGKALGLRLNKVRFWKDLGMAWAGATLVIAVLVGVLLLTGVWRASATADWRLVPRLIKLGFIGYTLFFMLVVALHEELLFRGFPLAIMLDRTSARLSVVAMSLIFAVFHLSNPGMNGLVGVVGFVNIALAGGILALLVLKHANLGAAIGFHAGWNWTQLAFGSAVSGIRFLAPLTITGGRGPSWLQGGALGLEGSLFCLPVLAVGLGYLVRKSPAAFFPVNQSAK